MQIVDRMYRMWMMKNLKFTEQQSIKITFKKTKVKLNFKYRLYICVLAYAYN